MEFEWDETKNSRNLAKHGLDFRDAIGVFRDENRIWGLDQRHSDAEDRWWNLGIVRETVIFTVTVERDGVIRMITARKATRHEQEADYKSLTR